MKKGVHFVIIVALVFIQLFIATTPAHAAIALVVNTNKTPGTYYMDYSPKIGLYSYPGSIIVYTTDGTTPSAKINAYNVLTITNGKRYTGAITISGYVNIRAMSLLNWYTPKSAVYSFVYNIKKSAPADNPAVARGVYYLPYTKGESYYVSRAGVDHQNKIDFVMPRGKSILAARGGYIRAIVEKYTVGGCNTALKNYANYVAIEDTVTKEWAYYYHLDTNSVPDSLTVGTYVSRGTLIGKAGNIGYSCGSNGGYHLHFEVKKDNYTVKIPYFADVKYGIVKTGYSYLKGSEIRY
jgi:murein DD-endopeptidase MepM/ murein hydrolase activator NlpD